MRFGGMFLAFTSAGLVSASLVFGACSADDTGRGGGGGSVGSGGTSAEGGSGGGTGGCGTSPRPNVLVEIRAADRAALPPDTTILADWSGGEAGPWVLGDPKTWTSLERSNLVCDVDPRKPPPALAVLHCQIWTTGPTRVRVGAEGFPDFDDTVAPSSAPCTPPGRIVVELEKPDGGG